MNNLTFQEYEASLSDESSNKGDSAFVSSPQSSSACSTNFYSVDASASAPDSDTSNLRRLIENDTFLKNVSKNDSDNLLHIGYPRLKRSPNCKSSPKPEAMDTSTTSSTNDQFLDSPYCPNKRRSKSPDSGYLQCLMTSLEEASLSSKTNPRKISGLQLMRLIETRKFNETMIHLAHDLVKSSKEITIEQLTQVLVDMLQTDSSCSNSFFSSTLISRLSEKKIEDESSLGDLYFDLSDSSATRTSKTPEGSFELKTVAEGSSEESRMDSIPLFASIKSNKQNILQINKRGTISPKKNKNRFSSIVWQYPSFKRMIFKPQQKKHVPSPRFKLNEDNEKEMMNSTTDSEAFFMQLEKKLSLEEKESKKNLRTSVSVDNILREESTTSEDLKLTKDDPEIGQLLENISHPVQRNSVLKNTFPEIVRKKILGQKNNPSSPKLPLKLGLTSSTKSPTLAKIQHWKKKHFSNWMSPKKSSNSNKSFVIDSSSLRPVSQTRKLFSPAAKAQAFRLGIPRVKITECSEGNVNTTPKKLNRERILRSKSPNNNSPRKPWRS